MKKIIGLILCVVLIGVPFFENKLADANYFSNKIINEWQSVEQRVDLMDGNDIQANQMEWTIKELVYVTRNRSAHLENLQNLQNRIQSMIQVTSKQEETAAKMAKIKLGYTDSLGKTAYIILTYQQENTYFTELCYQFQSTSDFSFLQKKYMEKIIKETNGLFGVKSTIFSCIQGSTNDKLVKSLREKMERILQRLDAVNFASLDEGTFVSCTAYTSQWKNTFSSAEKKLNLQLAFRVGDQKTAWFFGTPMILGEYE